MDETKPERPSYRGIVLQNAALKAAAGHRCQGSPKHPACRARADIAHPETDRTTTLHVIGQRVMCMRCVLSYDYVEQRTQGWRERRQATGNLELFPIKPERR